MDCCIGHTPPPSLPDVTSFQVSVLITQLTGWLFLLQLCSSLSQTSDPHLNWSFSPGTGSHRVCLNCGNKNKVLSLSSQLNIHLELIHDPNISEICISEHPHHKCTQLIFFLSDLVCRDRTQRFNKNTGL